jgi:predicted GNAT family acetyltransferase
VGEWVDLGGFEQRRKELYEEAERGRLARRLREERRAREVAARGARAPEILVRWGLPGDEAGVAKVLELNGLPRWVAFEERFIVAERGGEVLAALRYATESKRLVLGLLVVDPWAGELRVAKALYAGARELAREMGVAEIYAACTRGRDYPAAAGYRRSGGGWYASAEGGDAGVPDGWRAGLASWAARMLRSRRVPRGEGCGS